MGLKGTSTATLEGEAKVVDQSKAAPADTAPDVPWEEETTLPESTATAPSTALAQAQQEAKALTANRSSALAALPDDGFNDLDKDIGFGSFPIIKLDKDKFEAEGISVDQFLCQILMVKPKYIYRAGPGEDVPIFYSYDKETNTSGASVESLLNAWVAEGWDRSKFECKEYKEVVVKMLDTDLAGSLALLSVPPASANRLGGYRAEIRLTRKKSMSEVITLVTKGNKIAVAGGKKTFYPWNFKYARDFDPAQD